MSIDRLINLLAAITLIEMMITIGLRVDVSDILRVAKDRQLAVRAVVANYILLPAAVVGLLFLFHSSPLVSTGFLVVAACPGAPYAPPFTGIAKGNVPVAVGLMVILAASSAIVAPLLLGILLPIVGGTADVKFNVPEMIGVLLGAQLLPLCLGLWIRRHLPSIAGRLSKPASALSLSLNLLTLGAIILTQFQMLKEIRLTGTVGMLCLLIAALAAGRLMSGQVATSKSFVLTTAVRNAGGGLVIVTSSFPGTAAITSVIAYALFQTVATALIALAWGRLSPGIHLVSQRAA